MSAARRRSPAKASRAGAARPAHRSSGAAPSASLPFSQHFIEDFRTLAPSVQVSLFCLVAYHLDSDGSANARAQRWVRHIATEGQRRAALAQDARVRSRERTEAKRKALDTKHEHEWHQLRARHTREVERLESLASKGAGARD